MEQNVTGPPKLPPSNLTVLTVEGCPSFVILDWEKTDNETTGRHVLPQCQQRHFGPLNIEYYISFHLLVCLWVFTPG